MKKLVRRIAMNLTQSSVFAWLMLKIIPFIRITTYYTQFPGWKYQQGYALLEPGDIILTVDDKKLTSFLIPGLWSHAAVCVGKNCKWEISEMTHENYKKSTFMDICAESTRVVILRPNVPKHIRDEAILKCKMFIGAKYDLSFTLGVKFLYCSELAYESYLINNFDWLNVNLSDFAGLGVPYVSPDDLYAAENVNIVWDSNLEQINNEELK